MKFGQDCEILSKVKKLLVFFFHLSSFLFKFTLNVDKPECTVHTYVKSQREFMTFTILGGGGLSSMVLFVQALPNAQRTQALIVTLNQTFIIIKSHWCLQNGDFYNQL